MRGSVRKSIRKSLFVRIILVIDRMVKVRFILLFFSKLLVRNQPIKTDSNRLFFFFNKANIE